MGFVATLTTALVVIVHGDDQGLLFESLESKTGEDQPVFNRIRWLRLPGKDVWMMNQSHHGPGADGASWERLAIVVDRTTSPPRAEFFQLAPGALTWSEHLPQRGFRVACFLCHNNGPRALRPNWNSALAPLPLMDRLRIAVWNFRIRSYGRIEAHARHDAEDLHRSPPFRYRGDLENEPLRVAACASCHREAGPRARGLLRRQQFSTIRFLVERGEMPPRGHPFAAESRRRLERFLRGLDVGD